MGDGQPRLLDQIWDRIRRKHYSIRTEQAHVPGVRRFVLHHNERHPRDMGSRGRGLPDPPRVAKGVGLDAEPQYFPSDLNQKRLRVPVHELHIDFERRSARIAPEASLACEALDRAVPRTCGGVLDTMASSPPQPNTSSLDA
jgi:hypothetical protein